MKTQISLLLVILGILHAAQAQTRFGPEIGVRSFVIDGRTYSDAGGSVTIDGRHNYFAAGVASQTELGTNLQLGFELDALLGGKTANHASTIKVHHKQITSAIDVNTRIGAWAGVSLSYKVTDRLSLGIEGGVAGVIIGSRLEKTGTKDIEHQRLEIVPLAGITAACIFDKKANWVGKVALQGGEFGLGVAAGVSRRFW